MNVHQISLLTRKSTAVIPRPPSKTTQRRPTPTETHELEAIKVPLPPLKPSKVEASPRHRRRKVRISSITLQGQRISAKQLKIMKSQQSLSKDTQPGFLPELENVMNPRLLKSMQKNQQALKRLKRHKNKQKVKPPSFVVYR